MVEGFVGLEGIFSEGPPAGKQSVPRDVRVGCTYVSQIAL